MEGRILVFSITGCPHCNNAKTKLKELGLPYHDINIGDHPNQRELMIKLTSRKTVPQIFFNEKHVGGNDDFQALSKDQLDELIQYVMKTPAPEGAPKPLVDMKITDDSDFLSQKDQLASLVEQFKNDSDVIQDHRHMLIFSTPNSFFGQDLVEFIMGMKKCKRGEAFNVAKQMMEKKFVTGVKEGSAMTDDKTLYRLIEDLPSNALNSGLPAYSAVADASKLSTLIRTSILKLYQKFLSSNGKSVDYEGIGKSQEFKEYVELSAQLQRVNVVSLKREEKIAFFINIYNALVIHGNVKHGFPSNPWKRYKFFNQVSYVIGGHSYSLQDIENGVLRSNRKGIGMVSKPFSKNDPRLDTIITPHEPLIHFALVCGAKSCPPIKTYSAENITKELKLAASSFLENDDGCNVIEKEGLVELSMIFKWYKEDFGANPLETLKWVRDHMDDGKKKTTLSNMIKSEKYNLTYITYNWGSNSK